MENEIFKVIIEKLEGTRDRNWAPHYLLRRLPILGTCLFLPALSVILFSYLTVPKDEGFNISHLSWIINIEIKHRMMILAIYFLSMIAMLAFSFGYENEKNSDPEKADEKKKTRLIKVIINFIAFAIAIMPLILPIDDTRHRVLFTFIWGAMLSLLSWQANRTFGYTRAWARSEYFLQSLKIITHQSELSLLDATAANAKRITVIEACKKETYADTVSDTFHFWERFTQK